MKPRRVRHKSFYLTPVTEQELNYLVEVFGECQSAVMRRLINEAYTILYYIEKRQTNTALGQVIGARVG